MGEKMSRCFMNGKSCVHEQVIKKKQSDPKKIIDGIYTEQTAFIIMPFDERMNALYKWEIAPYIQSCRKADKKIIYKVVRSDDINRVGYIVCEKICRQIQEADLIVVDVSYSNENVFYELGLAMALQKEILPICDAGTSETWINELKKAFGIVNFCKYTKYHFFVEKDTPVDPYIISPENNCYKLLPHMEGNLIGVLHSGRKIEHVLYPQDNDNKSKGSLFNYDFNRLCQAAIGNAIAQIFRYEKDDDDNKWVEHYQVDEILNGIQEVNLVDEKVGYAEVCDKLKGCACALIDVTVNTDTNYFWLGYLHGIGGNVIPVKRKFSREEEIANNRIDPFDIRALWRIVYDEDNPIGLSSELVEIFKIIYAEKAERKNRRIFWDSFLNDSEVHIFLGSYHLENLGRYAIGDWDYRTAAEITSFLSNQKETIRVTLASPQPQNNTNPSKEYADKIAELVRDKNCIIIASPDVNDLTEVVLCNLYGKEPFKYFKDSDFNGYIPYKSYHNKKDKDINQRDNNSDVINHEFAFYQKEVIPQDLIEKRGFVIRHGKTERPYLKTHKYPSENNGAPLPAEEEPVKMDPRGIYTLDENDRQTRSETAEPEHYYVLLGQLLVTNNPVVTKSSSQSGNGQPKKIIIISGISGPATFGIAQLLTGCVYDEFTVNCFDQNRQVKSEPAAQKTFQNVVAAVEEYAANTKEHADNIAVNAPHIDYSALSERLLSEINKVMETKGSCDALIDVGVYYPRDEEKNTYKKDERKIIAWKFSDVEKIMGHDWANPGAKYSKGTP